MAGVTWMGKPGALTPSGEWQMFITGRDAWLRYIDKFSFLSSWYNPQSIEVISTSADRSIMSAESYLKGLFPIPQSESDTNKIYESDESPPFEIQSLHKANFTGSPVPVH